MGRGAEGPGYPQPVGIAERSEQAQAREKLARRTAGQVIAVHRVAHGLCLKVGEDLKGKDIVLLGAMRSDAPPGGACGWWLHVDKCLGDDLLRSEEHTSELQSPCNLV